MTLAEIIIIAAGLSLDVYAFCLYKGAMVSVIDKAQAAKLCAVFTVFQSGAMILGNAVRLIPAVGQGQSRASHAWFIFSALLFFVIGGLMMTRAYLRRGELIEERKEDIYYYRKILLWCCITSIDSLIAGIGFSFLSVDLFVTAAAVAVTTACAVLLGLWFGYRLGCHARNKYTTLGGCIVLAGGIDVLIRFFTAG